MVDVLSPEFCPWVGEDEKVKNVTFIALLYYTSSGGTDLANESEQQPGFSDAAKEDVSDARVLARNRVLQHQIRKIGPAVAKIRCIDPYSPSLSDITAELATCC